MTDSKPADDMIDLVMLVDDNDTDNFISKRIIEITKFAKRVEIKNSGKSALQYLQDNQGNVENLPDLIFLDINMPIVDGFVFLFEFEMFPDELKNKCKVVILSSSDNKRDIEKIDPLPKPLLTCTLLKEPSASTINVTCTLPSIFFALASSGYLRLALI